MLQQITSMNKTIIVSNRLPLQVSINKNKMGVMPSVGGLATGMKSVHAEGNGIWVGWSGIPEDELSLELSKKVNAKIREENAFLLLCLNKILKNTMKDSVIELYGLCSTILWSTQNLNNKNGKLINV